jgi:hypothetical protein
MRLLSLIVLLASTANCAATEPATRPATTRPVPVAAIWLEGGMPLPGAPRDEWRKLRIGLWSDGTIVWGAAANGIGKPYQSARLDPVVVEKLINDLDAAGFFDDPDVNHHRNRFPPDAGHTVIAAESGGKAQRLALWRDPPADRFGEVWTAALRLIEQLKPAEEGAAVEKLDESVYQLGRKVR